MASISGKPQHKSKQRKEYEQYLKEKAKAQSIKIFATGRIIEGTYNKKLIGWDTAEGFFNVGDAHPTN